jgi:hypothetical protein
MCDAGVVVPEGTPTTTQVFSGSTIGFYAMGPIAAGQEITISYVELVASRQERRRALLAHYFFDIDDNTADTNITEASTNNEGILPSSTTSTTGSHAVKHWTTTAVATAPPPSTEQVVCRTARETFWRTDPADAALCALSWRCIDQDGAKPGSSLNTGDAECGSGVEVLPGSGAIGGTPAKADAAGAGGTEGMSMLEQLLGSGLGGDKLWEQSIGDDPSDCVAPEPDGDDDESELLSMSLDGINGAGTLGIHPGGTLRPKHSAAAIDQLPDDYGQKAVTAASDASLDQDALTDSELPPEVRMWGSDTAAAALRGGGDAVVQLLHEMAEAGWKHTGGSTSCGGNAGGGNSVTINVDNATDMVPLQRLLARCDDLLDVGLSGQQRLVLGPGHVLRLRLQSALMHTAIASGEWGVATKTAEQLTSVYNMLYPRYSPMLGLHWATLAKLLQFTGGRPQEALIAAERALEILGPTHRAAATAVAGVCVPQKSSVLAQLEQVRSESALELAQVQQAGRQAQLVA